MDISVKELNSKLLPVPVEILTTGKEVPADIYISLPKGQYMLFLAKNAPFDQRAHSNLQRGGTKEVFLDFAGCEWDDRDSHVLVYESCIEIMHSLWENIESQQAISALAPAVEAMASAIMKNDSAIWNMVVIADKDYHTYIHSVNVCAIMIAASQRILRLTRKELIKVGLGSILHDLGKTMIPDRILNKRDVLTKKEFGIIQNHPVTGE